MAPLQGLLKLLPTHITGKRARAAPGRARAAMLLPARARARLSLARLRHTVRAGPYARARLP